MIGIRLRKRRRGQLDVGPGDLESRRVAAPVPCLVQYFSDDRATPVLRSNIPLGRFDDGREARAVVRLIDVQNVIGSVRVRVQIEGRGEAPACGGKKKPVVPQMIVAIADRYIEGHSPEELLEVGSDVILGSARL